MRLLSSGWDMWFGRWYKYSRGTYCLCLEMSPTWRWLQYVSLKHWYISKTNQLYSMALVRERTIWSEPHQLLRIEGVAWSAQHLHGRIVGFVDQSRYIYIQLAPEFYSRGWMDPVSDHYFSENLVVPGMKPGTSGSLARKSWPLGHRGGPGTYLPN
jgi:hypothetical protein